MNTRSSSRDRTPPRRAVPALVAVGLLLVIAWLLLAIGRLEQHPKTALPTGRIWTNATRSLLRLITCGGLFNHTTRHYRDNLIVYASPTGN